MYFASASGDPRQGNCGPRGGARGVTRRGRGAGDFFDGGRQGGWGRAVGGRGCVDRSSRAWGLRRRH